MGGLAIQAFVLEELGRKRSQYLDRLTEVVLCGTPSGGLRKADWFDFLKQQISDMALHGPFIQKLRAGWKQLVDDHRSDPNRRARFRLTLVAGMKDTFVPRESSLDPFPFDEKEIVPGDHTGMVKPASDADLIYEVVKERLTRRTPTVEEWRLVYGEAAEAVEFMNLVTAATSLGDADAMAEMADKVTAAAPKMPRVERQLGIALLGQRR